MCAAKTITEGIPNRGVLAMKRAPTHPGEILADVLANRGMTAAEAARLMRIPGQRVYDIIKGRRNVTADTAVLLAELLDMSPEFWSRLAADFDLWHAVQAHRKSA